MAPLNKTTKKDESDKRVNDILVLARRVLGLLCDRSPLPTTLQPDLESGIKRLSILSLGPSVAAVASQFDSIGADLWNGTTNLLHDADEHQRDPRRRQDAPTQITMLLRVFAFHLLDVAYHASPKRTKDIEQRVRNFKLALKTSRSCLDNDELELALKVLEKCSDHVSIAEGASPLVRFTDDSEDDGGAARMKALTTEFYLLRIMHAWKSERLDIATHVTSKLKLQIAHATSLPEKAADLFFEIGKSLLRKTEIATACEWLERALTALDNCEVEHLSDDAADLRLSIGTKLVRCLSSSHGPEDRDRAKRIVQQLAEDPSVGNRLAVQVLQLDMLHAEAPVRLDRVQAILGRLVRSSVVTEQTFKIIMQAIHRTKKRSAQVACDVLDALIRDRLIPIVATGGESNEADQARLEKACVTFVLFAVNAADDVLASAINTLQTILDDTLQQSVSMLSAKAVHAMQTLIWKPSGSSDPSIADQWLLLLRHPAFEAAGLVNKAKIGRKAIVLAVERNDIDAAREAYFRMPPAAQTDNLTQYLVFKLALRSNDYDLACESLETFIKHTRDDGKFLYACVLEAQESNMRHVAVAAFEALLDKQPPGIHLPTLLRCTARLLAAELDSSTPEQTNNVVDEIVQVFENTATNVKVLKQGSGEQWRAEMQWWSKNAYNLSLKLCGNVHPEHLCRLLGTCTTFIDNYPNDGGVMHEDDLKRRKMLCHFLAASAFIVLARSGGEGEEYSLQRNVNCRQQVREFKVLFDTSQTTEDNSRRMFELLKYEVESILRLQQWDQLNGVLQACLDCQAVDRWNTLADLVLIIHSQSSTIGLDGRDNAQMISLIQRIINETWKKDKDLVKVSRWLRLSFSIDLSDGDGAFALKLLQQAADMAKKGYEGSSDQTYPETELQWLATSAFNKAIDFLSVEDHELSKSWIEGALEVARYAADGGALHGNLTYKKDLAIERMAGAGAV